MEKIKVEVYKFKATDGRIFDTEEECIHHEKMMSGDRKICDNCDGSGQSDIGGDGRGLYTCGKCKGKGWVQKVERWE